MSYQIPGFKPGSLTASADLSAKQYCFVKASGANTVAACSASTDAPIGVLQNKPTSGQSAEIDCDGITKVLLGGTVAAGAEVMSDANGAAITAATTGNRIAGIALEGGASGQIVAVKLYSGAPKV